MTFTATDAAARKDENFMIKARFNKSKKWYLFRSISEAEKYAENIGATRIQFEHDPVPLIKLEGEWCWLCT